MSLDFFLQRERNEILSKISELKTKLNVNEKNLVEELKKKYDIKTGDVIRFKNYKHFTYVVSEGFSLDFNDFTNYFDLKASLYKLNKSNKINKKEKDYEKRFVKLAIKVGTYNFENDTIIYFDNEETK